MFEKTVYSMTGFGSGSRTIESTTIHFEIKSVNNRGLKVNVRSRPSIGTYEKPLRDLIGKKISRGSVDVNISISRESTIDNSLEVESIAKNTVDAIHNIASKIGIAQDLTAKDIFLIPGIFDNKSHDAVTEEEWENILKCATEALAQLIEMRQIEGEATARRLLELVQPVEVFRTQAIKIAPNVVERQMEKLKNRLSELDTIRPCDEQALEREVAFFADKVDINEEMDRLESHLSQFRSTISTGGEIGKRIDFLTQEILREINTTASKANDKDITTFAVNAKMAVEKIKEQAANME